MKKKPLFTSCEWDIPLLEKTWKVIDSIAKNKYGLDFYDPQIEIVTSDQMLDALASVGLPVYYNHWSFGKTFLNLERDYQKGESGLAYEIVINSNPSIAYFMENNTMGMQSLVMAHACVGHSAFFKTNYLMKQWTNADGIIGYMNYAKNFIQECEKAHGPGKVERLLDKCHMLERHSIDKYQRKHINKEQKNKKVKDKIKHTEETYSDLWKTLSTAPDDEVFAVPKPSSLPEENLLYFIEKNSLVLESWEREVCRIVRQVSQYFYPQVLTKVMNEGFASFWHYTLMNDLYDEGHITEGTYLEFIINHTNVANQPAFDSKYYSGLNPYVLGFSIFNDVKRMCLKSTDEDKRFFPGLEGQDWVAVIKDIATNYQDSSFILQWLSPQVIRDLKLFTLVDEGVSFQNYIVTTTHEDIDFKHTRMALSRRYEYEAWFPRIEVTKFSKTPRPQATLTFYPINDKVIETDSADLVRNAVSILMGCDIQLYLEVK